MLMTYNDWTCFYDRRIKSNHWKALKGRWIRLYKNPNDDYEFRTGRWDTDSRAHTYPLVATLGRDNLLHVVNEAELDFNYLGHRNFMNYVLTRQVYGTGLFGLRSEVNKRRKHNIRLHMGEKDYPFTTGVMIDMVNQTVLNPVDDVVVTPDRKKSLPLYAFAHKVADFMVVSARLEQTPQKYGGAGFWEEARAKLVEIEKLPRSVLLEMTDEALVQLAELAYWNAWLHGVRPVTRRWVNGRYTEVPESVWMKEHLDRARKHAFKWVTDLLQSKHGCLVRAKPRKD